MTAGDRCGGHGGGVPPERDRDPAGRPHSRRPRDTTGRPLPHGAPGAQPPRPPGPAPGGDGGDRGDRAARAPTATEVLQAAQHLLEIGQPFAAHEVFEDAWRSSPTGTERDFWRGLAQLAVALTHRQRGNERGTQTLLERASNTLAEAGDHFGVHVSEAVAAARRGAVPCLQPEG